MFGRPHGQFQPLYLVVQTSVLVVQMQLVVTRQIRLESVHVHDSAATICFTTLCHVSRLLATLVALITEALLA